jgi:hypothetical protein
VLLERAQPIAQHHDLIEEGVDRHRLVLHARFARAQD